MKCGYRFKSLMIKGVLQKYLVTLGAVKGIGSQMHFRYVLGHSSLLLVNPCENRNEGQLMHSLLLHYEISKAL